MENCNPLKKGPSGALIDDVEENTTFYYSNFKLFHDDSELLFATYLTFRKNLQAFLGEEWEAYAKKTIFNTMDTSTIFIQSRDVFSLALEVWLELRKEINFGAESEPSTHGHRTKASKTPETIREDMSVCSEDKDTEKAQKEPIVIKTEAMEEEKREQEEEKNSTSHMSETSTEDVKGFELFYQKLRGKFTENHINEAFFKAIAHAFFVSAIKIWKSTVASYSFDPLLGINNGSLFTESKKFFFNKLQNVYKTKLKMLKPILVATEKIRDYIYKDSLPRPCMQTQMNLMDDKDKKIFNNFSSNLKIENSNKRMIPMPLPLPDVKSDDEQELKLSFNKLRINSNSESGSVLGKRSAMEAHSTIEIKKMNKKLEKLLNQNTIEFAAHYVNNMTKTTALDWQISRNFVTSMVEVNYNKLLQLENKLTLKADEMRNGVKIRFIQPAREFYNGLMETWMIFKANSLNREILFNEYLDKVKSNFGHLWNEKYLSPTHNFFMTLYYEWHHIKQIETDTEEKVLVFTRKVKESMLKIWEDNIVKKAEELPNRTAKADTRRP